MAKSPTTRSNLLSNIMNTIRGNFDLSGSTVDTKVKHYSSRENISAEQRSKLLGRVLNTPETNNQQLTRESIFNIVRTNLSTIGKTRMENRKILQLMPNVEKAARLMIATTMSPNDLSRDAIQIVFENVDMFSDTKRDELNKMATDFFHEKLNLASSIPSWLYQAGYESGASVFATIPLKSFSGLVDEDFAATESFVKNVLDPESRDTIFGFGDSLTNQLDTTEFTALENFATTIISDIRSECSSDKDKYNKKPVPSDNSALKKFVNSVLAVESLSLTDNPSVIQLSNDSKEKNEARTKSKLNSKFRRFVEKPIVNISKNKDVDKDSPIGVIGNPIFIRLPPESVSVIHTPGDPSDHQGYLVMLDRMGNPIDATSEQVNIPQGQADFNQMQGDVFNQVYSAYGFTNSTQFNRYSQEEIMSRVYNNIVTEHIKTRLKKAGFANSTVVENEDVMRCMFARFLQGKHTRVLFLPKELVTYLAFELDEKGYGVSRLEKIKFALGMKMAIQVSRALAAVKAAMDRRRIEVTFDNTMMDDPEIILNSIVQEYLRKSNIRFSTDPNAIQNQIADKSLSIRAKNVPGMPEFELVNEPDQRTASFDFDPTLQEQLDKEINNGLRVPAAAMNALGEDEYSRSVSTTNLFFAMDVAIDQDITKLHVNDIIQTYAKYSEEFINKIYEKIPSLKRSGGKKSKADYVSDGIVDDGDDRADGEDVLPPDYTVDTLIESMKISLPKPDVAPSKAQFEVMEAMISSITNAVQALFPDDLIGVNDESAATIRLLRARFVAENIRTYLANTGMSSVTVPDLDFSDQLKDIGVFQEAIDNVTQLLKDKKKVMESSQRETSNTGEAADDSSDY